MSGLLAKSLKFGKLELGGHGLVQHTPVETSDAFGRWTQPRREYVPLARGPVETSDAFGR